MQSIRKKSFAAEQLARQKKKSPVVWVFVCVIVVTLVIGGYVVYNRYADKEKKALDTASRIEKKMKIAVLPFEDMSPEKDQEYFCDGISEEIINLLSHVEGLNVIARNSSFSFKGKNADITDIGSKLDVELVLEGSVRKADNQLKITAQLIKVADQTHLFSKSYDRTLDDIFNVQEEISFSIVREMNITLKKNEIAALKKRPTQDLEAWELYLLGRHYGEDFELDNALDNFEKAVRKDPEFALAYAGIAYVFGNKGYRSRSPEIRKESFIRAKEAAEKALSYDDTLAEAYTVLAWVNMYHDWDWSSAEKNLLRALELNPGYDRAYHYYRDYYMIMGQWDRALKNIQRAVELDPLYSYWQAFLLLTYECAGRYDEVIEECDKYIGLYPDSSSWFYLKYGNAYTMLGLYEKAREAYHRSEELSGKPVVDEFLGILYARSGEREKAEQVREKMIERNDRLINIAVLYAELDDYDTAFELLEKAYDERDTYLPYLNSFAEYEPLRRDPRGKALLKKMGLPLN